MPKSPIVDVVAETGHAVEPPPPEILEPDADLSPEEIEQARRDYLLTRFWISAKGFGVSTAANWDGCCLSA